jgi:hypothetical protein
MTRVFYIRDSLSASEIRDRKAAREGTPPPGLIHFDSVL